MKPKLVMLNGPCGIGKSTLAQRYVDQHPLALNLDMDSLWAMMGQWREHAAASGAQKLRLAHAMAEAHLLNSYDVVVPNILTTPHIEAYEAVAHNCGALLCEIMILTDKETAIARFIRRGQADGYTTGFRPGGTLERGGGVAKLTEMYDGLQTTLQERPGTVVIQSIDGDVEGTYRQIVDVTNAMSGGDR